MRRIVVMREAGLLFLELVAFGSAYMIPCRSYMVIATAGAGSFW